MGGRRFKCDVAGAISVIGLLSSVVRRHDDSGINFRRLQDWLTILPTNRKSASRKHLNRLTMLVYYVSQVPDRIYAAAIKLFSFGSVRGYIEVLFLLIEDGDVASDSLFTSLCQLFNRPTSQIIEVLLIPSVRRGLWF